ncbi:MAG TPA: hypothetical protein VN851_25500 [Thermoanaerobaculia bacterium]|nr:hypothetical protein [Thermoanaerobaculia bacterium]
MEVESYVDAALIRDDRHELARCSLHAKSMRPMIRAERPLERLTGHELFRGNRPPTADEQQRRGHDQGTATRA